MNSHHLCFRDIAQQICDGEIQRSEGCVLWNDPLTLATKKSSRQISRNEKTVAAYVAHRAQETVQ